MEIFFQGTVYLGVDFFLIKGMLCLFFMLAIQIWDITDNLFDIFHRIGNGFFFCSIHDLTHAFRQFFLQLGSIEFTCRYSCLRCFFGCALRCLYHLFDDIFPLCTLWQTDLHHAFFLTELLVFILLCRSQRLIQALQIQCFLHVFTIAEPKDQFIAGFHTLVPQLCLSVQNCQLISPFFCIFMFFEFFQDRNTVCQWLIFQTADLISQHITHIIFRCNLKEFVVIFLCLIHMFCLNGYLCQLAHDISANRRMIICLQQYFTACIVFACFFINLANHAQRCAAADLFPIDGICHLRCCQIISCCEQILNLLQFQFILILIHRYSPHVCILLIFQMLFFLF